MTIRMLLSKRRLSDAATMRASQTRQARHCSCHNHIGLARYVTNTIRNGCIWRNRSQIIFSCYATIWS